MLSAIIPTGKKSSLRSPTNECSWGNVLKKSYWIEFLLAAAAALFLPMFTEFKSFASKTQAHQILGIRKALKQKQLDDALLYGYIRKFIVSHLLFQKIWKRALKPTLEERKTNFRSSILISNFPLLTLEQQHTHIPLKVPPPYSKCSTTVQHANTHNIIRWIRKCALFFNTKGKIAFYFEYIIDILASINELNNNAQPHKEVT